MTRDLDLKADITDAEAAVKVLRAKLAEADSAEKAAIATRDEAARALYDAERRLARLKRR